ncbi:hypothetical protein Q3H58_000966 [Pseudomonas psychrotolerans]|nr:hypothetical protein [Pseudomonas psychrotolerans]
MLTRDLPGPSPLAAEVLTAKPYAYLDDAPVEERRTLAVQNRRFGGAEPDELGALDPAAIALVREEAWPRLETADELHEALLGVGFLTEAEVASHPAQAKQLTKAGRAGRLRLPETTLWIAAERLPLFQRLFPEAPSEPALEAPPGFVAPADAEAALVEVLRARLTALGPIAQAELAASLGLPPERLTPALLALQGEGYVLQGHFTAEHPELEWCERHLLARIHRYTLGRLRKAIEPVALADYLRFLLEHHHLAGPATLRGGEGLEQVVGLLEGFEVAAAGWEGEILPSRLPGYLFTGLDDLCRAGAGGLVAPTAAGPPWRRTGQEFTHRPVAAAASGRLEQPGHTARGRDAVTQSATGAGGTDPSGCLLLRRTPWRSAPVAQ